MYIDEIRSFIQIVQGDRHIVTLLYN